MYTEICFGGENPLRGRKLSCIRDNTFCIPRFFEMQYLHEELSDCSKILHSGSVSIEEYILGEYDTYGQIRANKGKYDQIRVINAT